MEPRHQIVYKYKYTLYPNNGADVLTADLPDDVTPEKFMNILSKQNLSTIGKISVLKTKHVFDLRSKKLRNNKIIYQKTKTLNIYVDDYIRTGREVKNKLIRQYEYISVFPVNPEIENLAPFVLTEIKKINRNAVIFGTDREYSWHEYNAKVEHPDSCRDIIINQRLQQIWPRATQKLPQQVYSFFNHAR